MIKISVIIPVFNCAKYLKYCVSSVLHQMYDSKEIVLIDDGSKDDSGRICDELKADYPDVIKVFHQINSGQLASRLIGIENSTGDYCMFLDADDYLEKNALQILNKYVEQSNCDCLIFNYRRFKDDKVLSHSKIDYEEPKLLYDKQELLKIVFLNAEHNSMCRKLVKRNLFDLQFDFRNYFKVRFGEDFIQSLYVYDKASSFLLIPDILYNYRINEGSITFNKKIDNIDPSFTSLLLMMDFVRDNKCFDSATTHEFNDHCVVYFARELLTIARIKTSYKKIRMLFLKIQNERIYTEYLSKIICSNKEVKKYFFILKLFRLKHFLFLFLLSKFWFLFIWFFAAVFNVLPKNEQRLIIFVLLEPNTELSIIVIYRGGFYEN